MKAMIVSDFAVLRSALLQLLGICIVIALFMGYAMGAVGTAAAIAAMVPFMGLFSLGRLRRAEQLGALPSYAAPHAPPGGAGALRLHRPSHGGIPSLGSRAGPGNCGPGGAPAGGVAAREPLAV